MDVVPLKRLVCLGARFVEKMDTTSPDRKFRQRVFKYRLLDIDRSSTASDVRSVRQLKISLFGGYIRGQEKSCSNEEEGS